MADDTGRTTVERKVQRSVSAIALVAIIALIGLGLGWRGLSDAQDNQQALTADIEKINQGSALYATDMELFKDRMAQDEKMNADLRDSVSALTKRVQFTQAQLQKAQYQAQVEAQQIRGESTQQIAAMGTEMNSQMATKASNDDVQTISDQVAVVRTSLDAADQGLQEARQEIGTLVVGGHYAVETL